MHVDVHRKNIFMTVFFSTCELFLTTQNSELCAHGLDTSNAQHTTQMHIPVVPWKLSGDATLREWSLLPAKLAANVSLQRIRKKLWCTAAVPEFPVAKVVPSCKLQQVMSGVKLYTSAMCIGRTYT